MKKVVFGTKLIFSVFQISVYFYVLNNNNYSIKVNYNYQRKSPRILCDNFSTKPFNFDNFIPRRMSDHNKTHVIIAKLTFFVVAVTRFHYRVKNK